MTYKLISPINELARQTALFYMIHLGHREHATDLAIKLIEKAARIEKAECEDAFDQEACDTGERWAVYTLIQGCYVREYHEWERALKRYISSQRIWNGLPDDFKWNAPRRNFVQLSIDALSIFSMSIDGATMASIDSMRHAVNNIKHDPLDYDVEPTDYFSAIKVFEAFWEQLMKFEIPIMLP